MAGRESERREQVFCGPLQAVRLPATTSAFASANIFARASGYIGKREVDIGDRVKTGQLLAEIVAPELEFFLAAKNIDPDYPLQPPAGAD